MWMMGAVLLAYAGAAGAVVASPPGQPYRGLGGQDYAYGGVVVTEYGKGAGSYWVFEPKGADKAKALPVVLFAHGLNATEYGALWPWIRHMTRRGNLVIYPRYQNMGLVNHCRFTASCASATRKALKRLDGKQHVRADTQRFAMVGHSLGGTIVANLAARYKHFGLPKPRALMPVQPGDVRQATGLAALLPTLTEDHSTIPAGTLMLVIATEKDWVVGTTFAKRIYRDAKQIKKADKDLLVLADDRHGRPALIADHFIPAAFRYGRGGSQTNAHDFALWRWFDALTDAAFYDGRHRRFALGNTPEQRSLGLWSDGRPVREPKVLDPQ